MRGAAEVWVAVVSLSLAALLLDGRLLVHRSGAGGAGASGARRGRPTGRGRVGGPAGPVARAWLRSRRTGAVRPSLGVLCTEVASRLRSGAGVAQAWRAALGSPAAGRPGGGRSSEAADGFGRAARAVDEPAGVPVGVPGDVTGDGVPHELLALTGSSPAADAVVVACRLAHRCGTPLAEILDECAHGITEVEAADADRRRALAGPAATARLLVWLPVASLGIGAGMGADPVGAVLAGGPALPAMAAGTACLLLGRWWIRRLVRSAERAGRGWGR